MRPLASLERLLERVFERPSARLFRAPLQPIVVERRIERAMEVERRRSGGRTIVPDVFTVAVHPTDVAALVMRAGGEQRLVTDLSAAALGFARAHSYTPARVPSVVLLVDASVPTGEVRVAAAFSGPAGGHPPSTGAVPGDPARAADARRRGTALADATLVMPTPVAPTALAELVVRERDGRERRIPLDGRALVIGRDPACDVVLADGRASRRHARIQARGGYLVLADIGSTNGTYLRDERVAEVVLGMGDVVTIGDTLLAIEPEGTGVGPAPAADASVLADPGAGTDR